MKGSNYHDTREAWLRAAANELRPFFERCGYELPQNIRFAIAFPSTGRKGKRVGECWHSSTSANSAYEIFLRADLFEPEHVLGVLIKELVHTLLPPDAGHGKEFRIAATRIGLEVRCGRPRRDLCCGTGCRHWLRLWAPCPTRSSISSSSR